MSPSKKARSPSGPASSNHRRSVRSFRSTSSRAAARGLRPPRKVRGRRSEVSPGALRASYFSLAHPVCCNNTMAPPGFSCPISIPRPCDSEKPIGRQRKVSRFGWGTPAEGVAEDDRDAELQIHRSCFLQLLWQLVGIFSTELVGWTTTLDLPALTAWSKTPPRPLREALRMGSGRAGRKRRPFRTTSGNELPPKSVHPRKTAESRICTDLTNRAAFANLQGSKSNNPQTKPRSRPHICGSLPS